MCIRRNYTTVTLLMCLLCPLTSFTQSSLYKHLTLACDADSITIDSLSLVPGSVIVEAGKSKTDFQFVQAKAYQIDETTALLIWIQRPEADSVRISYKTYPFNFGTVRKHKNMSSLDSAGLLLRPIDYNPGVQPAGEFMDFGGLNYNGSFARGLSFGNRQDVVINSTFNLQLSGELGDGIDMTAAITDNNLPVQPEGNTAQLQEFDKVFIQLSKGEQKLNAGDFELRPPQAYFMNFFKRLGGLYYTGGFTAPDRGDFGMGAAIALAKGKYRRQVIEVADGNQGPYKLTGSSGESFIIILSGSERVFVDGKLLKRGEQNDYIIDYNSGELLFMPGLMIKREMRVSVEFEYSDRNYFRSLAYGHFDYRDLTEKFTLNIDVLSQQDAKNQPLDQELNNSSKNALQIAGDQQAISTGIDSIPFDPSRIMYRMTDSLGYDSVFVFSTDAENAIWVLNFSDFGQGSGNYILEPASANGKVYRWVAPIDSMPQGRYEPVIRLVSPVSNQLLTIGGSYEIGKDGRALAELAMSREDLNNFSDKDDGDNDGLALKLNYDQKFSLGKKWTIKGNADYIFTQSRFRTPERFRTVEYERDWNLGTSGVFAQDQALIPIADEHLISAGMEIAQNPTRSLSYHFARLSRDSLYSGLRHSMSLQYVKSGLIIRGNGSFLSSRQDSTASTFFRPEVEISQAVGGAGGWRFGIKSNVEDNRFHNQDTDSLQGASFYNDAFGVFIKSPDSLSYPIQFDYTRRRDRAASQGSMNQYAVSDNLSFQGGLADGPASRLTWNIGYRNLQIEDTALAGAISESSLLGRVEHFLSVAKGLLRTDILYELGSGQEAKIEFTYVEVPPGQGTHTWIDYNGNEIAENGEFEIAAFADQGNYILVLTPSDSYLRADQLRFNYSLALNPKTIWYSQKGIRKMLSRFALQSSLQYNRKLLEGSGPARFVPFLTNFEDSLQSSLSGLFRQSVYFDRGEPDFSAEYRWTSSSGLTPALNGREERFISNHSLNARWSPSKTINTGIEIAIEQNELASAGFSERNYKLQTYKLKPTLTWLSGTKWRLKLSYRYEQSSNLTGIESNTLNDFNLESTFKLVGKSSIRANTGLVITRFEGDAESPVAFAMLSGLQNGNNLLWELDFEQRLSGFVQFSLGYEGRKTGDAAVNHIGRAQLRAIF